MIVPGKVFATVDAKLRIRGEFTYAAIEETLAECYRIGDDVPTIEDDELHQAVSELHLHYVDLGLAKPGI